MFNWSNGVRTELDGFYHLWSTHQEMMGQEITELSVKLDLLKADLDHLTDVHLIPMQDVINGLSQSNLILLGRDVAGLSPLATGCGRRDVPSQFTGENGPRATSPVPIRVPAPVFGFHQSNDSIPGLESVSSSSDSSNVSYPGSPSSAASSWLAVPSDYPRFADLYRGAEEGLGSFAQGELVPIREFGSEGASEGSSSEAALPSA